MKNLFFGLLLIFGLASTLCAQITVTNATFPAAGDTLKTIIDIEPQGIEITPSGGPYVWDFKSLKNSTTRKTAYRPAAEGEAADKFPDATLVAFPENGISESYYSVSSSVFSNLGFNGSALGGLPLQTSFKFDPPVPERRAPINFIDNHLAEASLKIALALSDIPGGILDSLPIGSLADSIRIRGTASRYDIVDAFGVLSIPGGSYDVLREKRTEYRETRLDIHTFLGWQDITSLILGGGGSIAEGLGKDTTVTYLFYSNTEKEIIASVETALDGVTVQRVTFKDNGVLDNVSPVEAEKFSVIVSPNPVKTEAVFEFKNWSPGFYTLQVFDANGAMFLDNKLNLQGNHTVRIDFSVFSRGAWFYRILNERGILKASGKVLKIN